MTFWRRIANGFRRGRLSREIDEESREPAEVRKAFGATLRQREAGRDSRVARWLDCLRADVVFGWRQLRKRKATSGAAILSLALATGACTSAFRVIDALLLRPLPVSQPERLYALGRQDFAVRGALTTTYDGWEYRMFRPLRTAVKGQAELLALSFGNRADLTYRSDQEMEKAHLQYVSGWMFQSFGLLPTAGRVFTENDDLEPGARPVAVLSYDYWSRRFGRDPKAIGRTFRLGTNHGQASPGDLYEIIGVGPESFSGTEPGTVTDIFLPTTMNGYVNLAIAHFLRTFVRLEPGVGREPVLARLRAAYQHLEEEERKSSPDGRNAVGNRGTTPYHTLLMDPAAAGVSGMQKDYRLPLAALGALVGLVLLIACANVANLMTAQAAARAREMALRVAIGAGRWRLVQLVLVESAMLAFFATALGALFASWFTPFVVGRINPPENPVRLSLPADWRVLGFGLALTLGVTLLFGLAPALRASAVKPASALKGGEDPHSRRRLMQVLITAQVVFCFLVLFIGGLFIATFDRLSTQPTGFSPERLLILDTVAQHAPAVAWEQVAEQLRAVPGVERVALAEWALMDRAGYKYSSVSIDGVPSTPDVGSGFLGVSPAWLDTMRIPLLAGRDFRASDIYLTPQKSGVAIVNQAFARQYCNGENPIGKSFETTTGGLRGVHFQIVGLVGDARYLEMREPIAPVAYNPFRWTEGATWGRALNQGTFIVRTSSPNPLTLASVLRREVSRARPDFYVSNTRTQNELIRMLTVRERLLAMLALFFAAVALLLAGVGMYGVLDYGVFQRTREIGIRMALGAQAGDIARRVAMDVLAMVVVGAAAGLALGMASVRYIESLLYQVKATDLGVLAIPSLAILAAALLAALPALVHAVRIDPVNVLRAE
ncbi:MAG TPA: ABC transporter permease [Candidatus Acidoferrales bacterium]|jgi:putative ABC transport system permease protein|nr:ABC transporter permease [Candidatus Acidoferrales bacterium]